MYRVEDKYVCNEQQMRVIESRIAAVLKPDYNQKSSVGYKVTSVYFDDLFDSHLQDTIAGYAKRNKYRIRIYDGSLDLIKLEVKQKQYSRILKWSSTISRMELMELLDGKSIDYDQKSLQNARTLFNMGIVSRGLRPKVIVEYERNAYVYDAGNVRITFDRNIRASNNVYEFGEKTCLFEELIEENCVLEVKYDEFLPTFIAQVLETGDMQQSSFSKYQLCRERIKG